MPTVIFLRKNKNRQIHFSYAIHSFALLLNFSFKNVFRVFKHPWKLVRYRYLVPTSLFVPIIPQQYIYLQLVCLYVAQYLFNAI